MKLQSINPSTGEVIGEVEVSTEDEIKAAVTKAQNAKKLWKETPLSERVKMLEKVTVELKKRANDFSKLASQEMGMPISQSSHDIDGAIEYFEWYLKNADKYLKPEVVYEDGDQIHTVYREPVGVVAAITPWNFPASNFVWMCGQNLVSGNVVIFKDSEEVPLCGKMIEEVMAKADLPEGVFKEVYGDSKVGEQLINQNIDMICFTGSTKTGLHIYQTAAKNFIKVFLELGGSAPGIVFEDADIDGVMDTIYANRFDNCGQICDGLKRLLVHKSKYTEVIEALSRKLSQVNVGLASEASTNIGPLVTNRQLELLSDQVKDAIAKGAKVEFEGKIDKALTGFFYPPTILSQVTKDMRVWQDEVFGPVLPVVSFETEAEAISLANDTQYGLGGYIFTQNNEKFERVSLQMETGMIQQNNTCYVTPATPFGGYKKSGLGREHGKYGFHDVTQVKVVSSQK